MSGSNQTSNKKSGSSNSSMVNTPASTPVTTMANGQTTTQTSPPPNNNAPKYGTLVPNRIFVGGISANTTEGELLQLFSNYGTVKAAKIIQDRAGVSKGYGFITFESEDDAKRLQREADNIVLRERKLNIAPAIKKQSLQPFSRAFDASSPPAVAPGNPAQYFFQPGAMPYFQGGVAYYPQPPAASADPATQQPTVYQPPSVYPQASAPPQTAAYPPVMFPAQPIYMPQQYPMPMPYEYNYYPNGGQYMVGGQGGPQSQVSAIQQRPNSPSRAPCYGQQLSYTNPPETMYYNVYGPVDGAMYADPTAMDMSMSNGTLPEDTYHTQDGTHEIPPPPTNNNHQINTIHKDANLDGGKLMEVPQTEQTNRQSNTPVVSLLSLDQHQEKDLVSMQSGRRRKVVPNNPPPHHYGTPNGFTNYSNFTSPGFGGYPAGPPQPYATNYGYQFAQPTTLPPKTPPMTNGYDKSSNTWQRKVRNYDRRSAETSSMSSIRSDSNSSASVVDENRNEEKYHTSPPPFHQVMSYQKIQQTRNFHSNVRPIRGAFDRRPNNPKYNANNTFRDVSFVRAKEPVKTPQFNNPPFTKPPLSPHSQMHAASNQHFVPPSRRNRRGVRRNGSSSLSEIGAGDAPLPIPTADVSEACNKLDSLKL